MNIETTIKINFTGGIIPTGDLRQLALIAQKGGIKHLSFGLRQQLYMKIHSEDLEPILPELRDLDIPFELNNDTAFPNIMSSYQAQDIFTTGATWLSEGVYKDIFDMFDYRPTLKININDANQSFSPLQTGNINWVSSATPHYWHLYLRLPKTNTVLEWDTMIYTNDLAQVSRDIENILIKNDYKSFKDSDLDNFWAAIDRSKYISKKAPNNAKLPAFKLPYYEGINPYEGKQWLGIYRRNELFPIKMILAICDLCQQTHIGQINSTAWKSIIIKGIANKDVPRWNKLLSSFMTNVRHPANELCFQVEDFDTDALELKKELITYLNDEDIRTTGLCIGIKTRPKK